MTSSCVASGLRRETLICGVITLLVIAGTEPTAIGASRAETAECSLLPAADLTPALERSGLTPRTQGSRNSCSVFVVAGSLEYALARRNGSGRRLSVEFLNWASNDAIGRAADGGSFSDLWKGFELIGYENSPNWPGGGRFLIRNSSRGDHDGFLTMGGALIRQGFARFQDDRVAAVADVDFLDRSSRRPYQLPDEV